MEQRFRKGDRLLARADFERVMHRGRRVFTRNLIVFAAPGEADRPRLGLAVGRRVGKAVCRSRWRRLIREAFRQDVRAQVVAATDLVVVVKAGEAPRTAARAWQRTAPGLATVRLELVDAIRRLALGGER